MKNYNFGRGITVISAGLLSILLSSNQTKSKDPIEHINEIPSIEYVGVHLDHVEIGVKDNDPNEMRVYLENVFSGNRIELKRKTIRKEFTIYEAPSSEIQPQIPLKEENKRDFRVYAIDRKGNRGSLVIDVSYLRDYRDKLKELDTIRKQYEENNNQNRVKSKTLRT